MIPRWRLQLLGTVRAVGDATTVERFPTRKTGAVLTWLALHQATPQPREPLLLGNSARLCPRHIEPPERRINALATHAFHGGGAVVLRHAESVGFGPTSKKSLS